MARHTDLVEQFVGWLVTHRGALFHTTDAANFSSIGAHGLLSKQEAAARGVVPILPGGSDLTRLLDLQHGLADVVFLGFHRDGVMPKHEDTRRQRRPRCLHVHPNVLLDYGVRIALGRANHRATDTYRASYAIRMMDFEALQRSFTGDWDENDLAMRRRVSKAFDFEVLIPTRIAPESILGHSIPA